MWTGPRKKEQGLCCILIVYFWSHLSPSKGGDSKNRPDNLELIVLVVNCLLTCPDRNIHREWRWGRELPLHHRQSVSACLSLRWQEGACGTQASCHSGMSWKTETSEDPLSEETLGFFPVLEWNPFHLSVPVSQHLLPSPCSSSDWRRVINTLPFVSFYSLLTGKCQFLITEFNMSMLPQTLGTTS